MRKLSIILCSLLVAFPLLAQQASLLSISNKANNANQLELDLFFSEKVAHKAFFLSQPNRLVIDLTNATLSNGIDLSVENSPYFKKIRYSTRDDNSLRVVLDFKEGVLPSNTLFINESFNNKHLILNLNAGSNSKQPIKPLLLADNSNANNYLQSRETSKVNQRSHSNPEDDGNSFFSDWEITGTISFEELGFFNEKLDSQQHNNYISGSFQPELYREWDGGKQSFTFSPFYRFSQHDSRRSHFDIRELTWLLAEDDWEVRVGFRKVFWGVAEGLHLVDIINQTDLIENTDTEDKLGQPMINLALIREWGTIDLFLLPGFRERTYPGVEGRFRSIPELSVGDAEFEHHGFEKHMAYAVRWAHVIGDWDIGISNFYGTSREPIFKPKISRTGSIKLIPYYELINQTGLDLQLTYEDWLVKHESIVRSGQGKTFYAMTTGIEYTLFDLFESGLDLGIVVEYMYDTRGGHNPYAPFQDDFLTALRFGFNDVQSTEILAGILFDRTNNTKFYNIEASRRIGDSFKLEVEVRLYSGAPKHDPSYVIREDDHIRMQLGYYF